MSGIGSFVVPRALAGAITRTVLVWLLLAGLVILLGGLFYLLCILGVVAVPLAIVAMLGLVNAFLFSRWEAKKLRVTLGQAFWGYLLAVLMANFVYLAFDAGFTARSGTRKTAA